MAAALMHGLLESAASRFGEKTAILSGDDVWTFAELDGLSNSFARHLSGRGVGPGDRVVVMMSNRPEFVVAVNAAGKLGAAPVLVSPAWKALEVSHAVRLTGAVHGVADDGCAAILSAELGPEGVTDLGDTDFVEALRAGERAALHAPALNEASDSVLVFSSGTTGLPKAVRHTHGSIMAATAHWCTALGLGPDDRFQVATPPSHILGLLNLLAATAVGATVRLHRRFDLDEVLSRIEAERMTLEMAVAPIALAMANHPNLESYDLSSLRYIMWGATPVTPSVAEIVTARSGVRWLPAYGASEVPVIAANPVSEPSSWRLDSAGLPPVDVRLRVVDLDSGQVLEAGETGEIQVVGPSVMAGYLPEEANNQAYLDGWYRTGDVGWIETAGWVHLTDRSKEMIKVNGFQVAPAELEALLLSHPAVVDCAVFGIADERAGERPVAAVQLRADHTAAEHTAADHTAADHTAADHTVTVEELKRLVADGLATYKQLQEVVLVDAIPRLPSGKVLRRSLRDAWPELPGRVGD